MKGKLLNKLRRYRFLNNEMTQEQLGRKIGLSRQSVCAIETGKRMPTLIQAYRISKLLNVSIEEIFFFEK